MMVVASDGYIIDILGPYLADGKNNDAANLNKRLSKKENCILEWFKIEVLGILLILFSSWGYDQNHHIFWERDRNNNLFQKLIHLG